MTTITTPTDIPFDSNATAYSLNNAYWLAQAANIAYQEKSTIQPAGLGARMAMMERQAARKSQVSISEMNAASRLLATAP